MESTVEDDLEGIPAAAVPLGNLAKPDRMDLDGRREVRQRSIQPVDHFAVETGRNASPSLLDPLLQESCNKKLSCLSHCLNLAVKLACPLQFVY
jgi:hypothetical protein